MATTGTNLSAIKAKLRDNLNARDGFADLGVRVRYGPPRHADDLTSDDGELLAVWFAENATADVMIPYLMAGAKVTHEAIRFGIVVQAIHRTDDDNVDGQEAADTSAESLLAEVLSELADDPSLALSTVEPLAVVVDGWAYQQLPRTANAWGTRFEVALETTPSGIAAPS